jgi:hypothetical protein
LAKLLLIYHEREWQEDRLSYLRSVISCGHILSAFLKK